MIEVLKNKLATLPIFEREKYAGLKDWLIHPIDVSASVCRDEIRSEIILHNGLIVRRFRIDPDAATVSYENLMTGENLLRSVRPEASLILNGEEYTVGGLTGQKEHAYIIPSWLETLTKDENTFHLSDFEVKSISPRFNWKRVRPCENREWPPKGVELEMIYRPPDSSPPELQGVRVHIHYECYTGIPLFSKWITVENSNKQPVILNRYVNEILALVEFKTTGGITNNYPHIYFEYDYAFAQMNCDGGDSKLCHWEIDPDFTSQVAYLSDSKNLMKSYLTIGPEFELTPATPFEGFREYQLIHSSYDRQRRGLARCQMYRTIAPWVTENPLMMHLTSFNLPDIQNAVKQMTETGFEMLIFSFGSNFNNNVLELGVYHPEWVEDMIEEFEEEVFQPIHVAGIHFGGYSLLASRRISKEDDVVNPYTGETSNVHTAELEEGIEAIQGVSEDILNIQGAPTFGNSPCIGSNWGQRYFQSLYKTIERLNLMILEHDGSYPGDVCASISHPGHRGLHDSQWTQWRTITDFYKWCRGRGVFLNVPDWYMLTGSNKTGIGYKEVNWSLPRDRQVLLGRQNIYDGTWEKAPTMGWTFVPISQYHSVPEYPAEVATLEPLSEHLDHYEAHLAQNLGCGVQACYRGVRLYDTEETKALVKKYVAWYKKYRDILDSDIVHIRRPDGRNIDGMLHVNPKLKVKGLAMFFNPTAQSLTQIIHVPLYYTGLHYVAKVSEQEGEVITYPVSRDYSIDLEIFIPARKHTWFIFR